VTIIQRVPWLVQPPGSVGVNWANPITRELNLLAMPGVSSQEVSRQQNPVSAIYGKGGGAVRGAGALAYVGDGSTNSLTYPREKYLYSGAKSVFSISLPTTITGADRGILSKNGTTTIPMNHGIEGATGRVFMYYFSGPHKYWTTDANLAVVNQLQFLGVSAPALGQSAPRFFVNGAFENGTARSGTLTGTPADPTDVDVGIGNYSAAGGKFLGNIYLVASWRRQLADVEFLSLYQNPWQLFAPLPRRIWAPAAAAGGTHPTSGAIVGAGAVVSGAALHPHTTTGTIAGPGAVVSGAAVHPHTTTGALTGPGAAVAGDAEHSSAGTFDTSGAITGPGAAVAGTAAHLTLHTTTGALAGPGASVAGDAVRVPAAVTHETSGVLVGPGAVVSGEASAGNLIGRKYPRRGRTRPRKTLELENIPEVIEKITKEKEELSEELAAAQADLVSLRLMGDNSVNRAKKIKELSGVINTLEQNLIAAREEEVLLMLACMALEN